MNKNKIDYKKKIEENGDYECIKLYFSGDKLPNGKLVKGKIYAEIKHNYCGEVSIVIAYTFIKNNRCRKCCGSYEKSFAHHIEVELNQPLDKYWDFEKNAVNPYHISKFMNGKNSKGENLKVWIKCQEKDYHGSYEIPCDCFAIGKRCSYCGNFKVHPIDSFAQYHIENTDKDFLEKYWDYDKNTIDPFTISTKSNLKVWIKCNNEEVNELNGLRKMDYHTSYNITCDKFTIGNRCVLCNPKGLYCVPHVYDSFGYKHLDKIINWKKDNNLSPFKVCVNSNKKYKFICDKCENEWEPSLLSINQGTWCPECSSSRGEKEISKLLDKNNIKYIHDKKCFDDLLSNQGNKLRPDFILPEEKIWIEYDGEFHYKGMVSYQTKYEYEILKYNDKIKNEYAKKNNWNLIRIPYWDFDNIEEILNKELN